MVLLDRVLPGDNRRQSFLFHLFDPIRSLPPHSFEKSEVGVILRKCFTSIVFAFWSPACKPHGSIDEHLESALRIFLVRRDMLVCKRIGANLVHNIPIVLFVAGHLCVAEPCVKSKSEMSTCSEIDDRYCIFLF